MEKQCDPESAQNLERWLESVEKQFDHRILDVTRTAADRWGRFPIAQPLPSIDSLLAATALANDLTVATRNPAGFLQSGVPCVNPFAHP